jgi:hypothetical protein
LKLLILSLTSIVLCGQEVIVMFLCGHSMLFCSRFYKWRGLYRYKSVYRILKSICQGIGMVLMVVRCCRWKSIDSIIVSPYEVETFHGFCSVVYYDSCSENVWLLVSCFETSKPWTNNKYWSCPARQEVLESWPIIWRLQSHPPLLFLAIATWPIIWRLQTHPPLLFLAIATVWHKTDQVVIICCDNSLSCVNSPFVHSSLTLSSRAHRRKATVSPRRILLDFFNKSHNN